MKEKYVVRYWHKYDEPEPKMLYQYEFDTFSQAAEFQTLFSRVMENDFNNNPWAKKYFWFTCEKEVIE